MLEYNIREERELQVFFASECPFLLGFQRKTSRESGAVRTALLLVHNAQKIHIIFVTIHQYQLRGMKKS
jgi:hypothetical protein